MDYFHMWSSLRVLFYKKRSRSFSTSYSFFFMSHLHQLSLGGSMIGLWIVTEPQLTARINKQANENSKGILIWIRERPETGDDGVNLQRQSLAEQCRHLHFSTSSEVFIWQRHLAPGNDFHLLMLMMRATSYTRLSKECLRIWSIVILKIISPLQSNLFPILFFRKLILFLEKVNSSVHYSFIYSFLNIYYVPEAL